MAHDAKTSFGLVHPQDDDLYYAIKQNIVGGPSIIFTRDAEVGCRFIRNDPKRPFANIVSYDANALYLDCIDKAMICGRYVRQMGPDFKPNSCLSCEDMFHWMDYLLDTENVHILHAHNHISEVPIGPYLMDSYDPLLKLCMNSMDVISMDVPIVRKTKTICVRREKCPQRPRKNISVSKATT